MNRKIGLFFFVILLLSIQFSLAYSDDFLNVFWGKTKSEVQRIAPDYEKISDNRYLIDYMESEKNDDSIAWLVYFDEKGIVDAVFVMFELEKLENITQATAIGLELMGVSTESIERSDHADWFYDIWTSDDCYCNTRVSEENPQFYSVTCIGPEITKEDTISSNTVDTGRSRITLEETSIQDGILIATFLIENVSDRVDYISSIRFSAKDSNYEKLPETFNCPGSSFSGQLAPGDKVRGNICFKGVKNKPITISYTTNAISGEIFTFVVE